MYRGDTNLVQVTPYYTDVNGNNTLLPVAGSTSVLTIKAVGGSAVTLQLTGAIVGDAVQFAFAPADTVDMLPQTYNYDVIYTVAKGLFKLLQDVTT
jgi:hypothetical protein